MVGARARFARLRVFLPWQSYDKNRSYSICADGRKLCEALIGEYKKRRETASFYIPNSRLPFSQVMRSMSFGLIPFISASRAITYFRLDESFRRPRTGSGAM